MRKFKSHDKVEVCSGVYAGTVGRVLSAIEADYYRVHIDSLRGLPVVFPFHENSLKIVPPIEDKKKGGNMEPKFKVGQEVIINDHCYIDPCFQKGRKVRIDKVTQTWDGYVYEFKSKIGMILFLERQLLPIKDKPFKNLNVEVKNFIAKFTEQYGDDPRQEKAKEEKQDSVNQPKHYMLLEGVEVRDVCTAMANRLVEGGYSGIFTSDFVQLLQYVLRFDKKNGKEDLEKARFYLEKMIDSYEKKED